MPQTLAIEQAAALLVRIFRPEAQHDSGSSVDEHFRNRTILITGAGGSIGSALVRHLLTLHTAKLIALDQDENAVFDLISDPATSPQTALIPILGNIRDNQLICQTFAAHRPEIVFHAAAYKHVPILESQCSEAVLNNISGTRIVAEAAIEFGCERFVFLSTDKAVRPTSILGKTKRVAELLIRQLAISPGQTTSFASVRFGNVLGSRGSVLPIFLRQIANGGPLKITHPKMTRYFITASEAVQLLLQNASVETKPEENGNIFVPDLGNPIQILDLAAELLRMHGLLPGKDIQIEFTGIRRGEKLHEGLTADPSHLVPTSFPGLFREPPEPIPPNFPARLNELESAAKSRQPDETVRQLLNQLSLSLAEYPSIALI